MLLPSIPSYQVKDEICQTSPMGEQWSPCLNHKKEQIIQKKLTTPNSFNQLNYSKYRNNLTKLLRHQERSYYENSINQNKHNLSKTWNIISSVINNKNSTTKCSKFTHNGRDVTDDRDIANYFNQYLANIGPNLAKNIPNGSSTYEAFLNHSCDNSILHQPVTEN